MVSCSQKVYSAKQKTNVAAYTLLTDKFSGPNLTTTNG